MHKVTALTLFRELEAKLNPFVEKDEIRTVLELLLSENHNISKADILVDKSLEISEDELLSIHKAVEELKEGRPVQHILGFSYFFGRKFKVSPEVLIPRQETEELVAEVLKILKPGDSVLDIGTGSGIIPISIKLEYPQTNVSAWDVSEAAIDIAKKNAQQLNAEVDFGTKNILKSPDTTSKFHVIVSNPPYVLESGKEFMSRTVLDFDPAIALFVPDEDPLRFYKAISEFASLSLHSDGWLFFEINEQYGAEVANCLEDCGFSKVQIISDLNARDRIVKGLWKADL